MQIFAKSIKAQFQKKSIKCGHFLCSLRADLLIWGLLYVDGEYWRCNYHKRLSDKLHGLPFMAHNEIWIGVGEGQLPPASTTATAVNVYHGRGQSAAAISQPTNREMPIWKLMLNKEFVIPSSLFRSCVNQQDQALCIETLWQCGKKYCYSSECYENLPPNISIYLSGTWSQVSEIFNYYSQLLASGHRLSSCMRLYSETTELITSDQYLFLSAFVLGGKGFERVSIYVLLYHYCPTEINSKTMYQSDLRGKVESLLLPEWSGGFTFIVVAQLWILAAADDEISVSDIAHSIDSDNPTESNP